MNSNRIPRPVLAMIFCGFTMVAFSSATHAGEAEDLFDKQCALCHAKDGKGQTLMGQKLGIKTLTDSKLTEDQIILKIQEGKLEEGSISKMSPFKQKLTAEQILSLVPVVLRFRTQAAGDGENLYHMFEHVTVPDGNDRLFHVYAEGVQIYRWDGTNWLLKGPEAKLLGWNNVEVGRHYKGEDPTWEHNDGSKVACTVITNFPSPEPDSIPWLLLKAKSTSDNGVFSKVSYIQRVKTSGGQPPATDGAHVGQEVSSHYTAEYYFYRQRE